MLSGFLEKGMKSWLIGAVCLLISGAAVAAGPAEARKRIEASMLLTGMIVIAPDGSVRSYAIDHPDKVEPEALALVSRNVPAWKFKPVLFEGKPVAAQAAMSIRIVAQRASGDNFRVAISGTHFGKDDPGTTISYATQERPYYPRQAVEERVSGTVYLLLRVGKQGQVEAAAAEQVNLTVVDSDANLARWREMLAQSALKAARKWTFHPPTTGSHVSQSHWFARVPVSYQLRASGRREVDTYGQWEMYVPGPKELVPWVDDQRLLSDSPDALPDNGVYELNTDGLRLMTSPRGT